jgi:hypothetical protein
VLHVQRKIAAYLSLSGKPDHDEKNGGHGEGERH